MTAKITYAASPKKVYSRVLPGENETYGSVFLNHFSERENRNADYGMCLYCKFVQLLKLTGHSTDLDIPSLAV